MLILLPQCPPRHGRHRHSGAQERDCLAAGKQPDGSAGTVEAMLLVQTAGCTDKETLPVRKFGPVTCAAAVESAIRFGIYPSSPGACAEWRTAVDSPSPPSWA